MKEMQETKEMQMPEIKIWNGQRVVTFKDIDRVHERPAGTAKKRFSSNKKRFIDGTDYYLVTPKMLSEFCEDEKRTSEIIDDVQKSEKRTSGINEVNNRGTIFLTETGYLMIVKSFTDDLAWQVQRQLVNTYFTAKDMFAEIPSPELPVQSSTPVPLRRKTGWYYKNQEKIYTVCVELNMSHSELYHNILYFVGRTYDLNAAKAIYKKERGYAPRQPMDIVEYFPDLGIMANEILESYYRIATT